jgi:hypothetical protein
MKATDFLKDGLAVLNQRAKEYVPHALNETPQTENSFGAIANAFNAITHRDLVSSDIALILDLLKKVRQYSNPNRLHFDSLQDSVNYTALWAANLCTEFNYVKQESNRSDSEV